MKAGVSALAVFAALLAAGCAHAPAESTAPSDDTPVAALTFDAPTPLGPGAAGENFVAISHDGRLLVCGHGTFTAPTPLWVVDGQAAALHDHGAVMPAGDCDIDVGPDGTWTVTDVWLAGVTVTMSKDGSTWTRALDVAPPVTGTVDRPWLGYVGQRMLVSYQGAPQLPLHVVAIVHSDDGGATWSMPRTLVEGEDDMPVVHNYDFDVGSEETVWSGVIAYDPEDTSPAPSVRGRFMFLRSDDRGDTWMEVPVLDEVFTDTIVAPGVAGRDLYWVWAERHAPEQGGDILWLLHSPDEGVTWSAPVELARGGRIFTPAIDGRSDGSATVAWIQEGANRGGHAARITPLPRGLVVINGTFQPPTPPAQFIEYMDVAHDADGRAIIAYSWAIDDMTCLDPRYAAGVLKVCGFVARESLTTSL